MYDMLQEMYNAWANTKPDNTPTPGNPLQALAASAAPPGPPPLPRMSPAAELQEKWRMQAQRRDEVRQGNPY